MVEIDDETLMDSFDDESFTHVAGTEPTNITLTLTAKNDIVGRDAPLTTTQICATMRAPPLPSGYERPPVDIVVALDISGSMQGSKLDLCKQTLEQLVRLLLPHDRFALITYSTDAFVSVPIQFMTKTKKDEVMDKIKKIHATNSTNISAAIALSFDELRTVKNPNHVRSIFLLTDGHANVGITGHADLVELTRNCWHQTLEQTAPKQHGLRFAPFLGRKASTKTDPNERNTPQPISMFCFGYGSDHNAELLRDITNATETGTYFFVKDDSNVGSAFGSALGGILSVVGQSAVLTLSPSYTSALEIKHVHHEKAIRREDGTYTVGVGDFYAEESRDVVVEVTLSRAGLGDAPTHVGIVGTLAYADVLRKEPVNTGKVFCTVERPEGSYVSPNNAYVVTQWLRVMSAQKLKEAEQLAAHGDLTEARKMVQTSIDACMEVQDDEMIDVLREDLETAMRGLQSSAEYVTFGNQYISFKQQTYERQRCSETNTGTRSAFRGSHKLAMAKRFEQEKNNQK